MAKNKIKRFLPRAVTMTLTMRPLKWLSQKNKTHKKSRCLSLTEAFINQQTDEEVGEGVKTN